VVVVVVVDDDDEDENEGVDEDGDGDGDDGDTYSDEGMEGQTAIPELLGELHSGFPELGLELGLEANEKGRGL